MIYLLKNLIYKDFETLSRIHQEIDANNKLLRLLSKQTMHLQKLRRYSIEQAQLNWKIDLDKELNDLSKKKSKCHRTISDLKRNSLYKKNLSRLKQLTQKRWELAQKLHKENTMTYHQIYKLVFSTNFQTKVNASSKKPKSS